MKYFIPILILTSFHFTSYTQDCKYVKITFEVHDTVNDKPSSFLRACLFSDEFKKYPCTLTLKGELWFRILEEDINNLHLRLAVSEDDDTVYYDKELYLNDILNLNNSFISCYRITVKEYKYIKKKEYNGFYGRHSFRPGYISKFDVYCE